MENIFEIRCYVSKILLPDSTILLHLGLSETSIPGITNSHSDIWNSSLDTRDTDLDIGAFISVSETKFQTS